MIVLPGIITPKRKESVDTLSEELFVANDKIFLDHLYEEVITHNDPYYTEGAMFNGGSEEIFSSFDSVLMDSLVEEIFYE